MTPAERRAYRYALIGLLAALVAAVLLAGVGVITAWPSIRH